MFNLCCLFCGALLSVNELKAKCLDCRAEYDLILERHCVKQVNITKCGRMCTCEEK